MQDIKVYVSAAEVVGAVRDYANAKKAATPMLIRGVQTKLRLRLFDGLNSRAPYPIDNFADVVAWKFVVDRDFDAATNYILQADNANISVATVQETDDEGTERSYTEISIPIPDTNTEELTDWLGRDKSKGGLTAELVGYNAEAVAIFILQLENLSVRNRLTSLGDPSIIDPEYLTEAQVRALITENEQKLKDYIDEEIASKLGPIEVELAAI